MYASSLISKVEKARRYAAERDRISFSSFQVSFRGDNNTHTVQYDAGNWKCTCSFFPSHGTCSHTMAMERVLEGMLTREAKATA
ncbi:MAG: hypothetical protein Q8O40_02930 [Chloroflexota bacterium]|nr:hypothetical protein [Chloroflexota bacterium]MDP3062158.1 hypothetical protein [Chloroflexota bacterium]